MKKVLTLAVAAALAAPAMAMADSTIYGKVRVSEDSASVDNTGNWVVPGANNSEDSWGTTDHSSRVGIKGSEDLGNGLSAIYQMEFGVKVGESFSSMSGRNAFVGLAGDFGTFLIGRHDTPMKISTGKLDLFGDTMGDYNYAGLISDLRIDGAIAYISPAFNGLTLAGAVVSHPVRTEDFADAYSLAALYGNGPIYASLAYETHNTSPDKNNGIAVSDLLGDSGAESQIRLGLGLMDWNNLTVTFVWESRDGIDSTDADAALGITEDKGWDSDTYVLSGAYKFTPNDQVKAMFGSQDAEDANTGATDESTTDQWAIGYQHNLSNRTDVQVVYTSVSYEEQDTAPGGTSGGEDTDVLSFQLNHSF